MASSSSPWAKGPSRELGLGSKAGDLPKLSGNAAPFSPRLMSNPEVRKKVPSSGYGVEKIEYKRSQTEVHTLEQKELEKATFKPNLNQFGKKLRKQAQSTGYGKEIPAPREIATATAHAFKPETAFGKEARKLKKSAPSSNYGRETAAAKELPKAPKMTFQPNLDLSATAKKMRSKAPSGTYLQERPRTAPAKSNKPQVLRHTLAEDKGKISHEPKKDVGPGFNLNVGEKAATSAEINSGSFPYPEILEPSAEQKKLKESAKSSGYTTADYEPTLVPAVQIDTEPSFRLGTASTTYIDSPTKMEKFEPSGAAKTMLKKCESSGYSKKTYEPAQGQTKKVEAPPLWKATLNKEGILAPVDQLERPQTADSVVKKDVQSSGYGAKGDWQPPLGEKKQIEYYRPSSPQTVLGASMDQTGDNLINIEQDMETADDGAAQDEGEVTSMPLDGSGGQDIDEY